MTGGWRGGVLKSKTEQGPSDYAMRTQGTVTPGSPEYRISGLGQSISILGVNQVHSLSVLVILY